MPVSRLTVIAPGAGEKLLDIGMTALLLAHDARYRLRSKIWMCIKNSIVNYFVHM